MTQASPNYKYRHDFHDGDWTKIGVVEMSSKCVSGGGINWKE
jgi:hypothetical protein